MFRLILGAVNGKMLKLSLKVPPHKPSQGKPLREVATEFAKNIKTSLSPRGNVFIIWSGRVTRHKTLIIVGVMDNCWDISCGEFTTSLHFMMM